MGTIYVSIEAYSLFDGCVSLVPPSPRKRGSQIVGKTVYSNS